MSNAATVIIAAWNAEDLLGRSAESALQQRGVDTHVIVANDASTDGTSGVARSLPGVQLVDLPVNSGPAAARNVALDHVSTPWSLVLDADDTLDPDHAVNLIDLATRTDADIVLSNFRRVDLDGVAVGDAAHLDPATIDPEQPLEFDRYLAGNLIEKKSGNWGYLKPLFRTEALARLNLRYNEALRNSEDTNLILEAILKGARVVVSPDPSYRYTVRSGSISHRITFSHIEALLAEEQKLRTRWSGDLSETAVELFEKRWLRLKDMLEAERVIRNIKDRSIAKAARGILVRPRTAGRIAAQISEGMARRLGTLLAR